MVLTEYKFVKIFLRERETFFGPKNNFSGLKKSGGKYF
jgi:hypothetical protein